MPTEEDRKAFENAIKQKDSAKIRELLQREDAKELLLMKDQYGYLPVHNACRFEVDESCLQLILDVAVKYGVIKQMLDKKTDNGTTCLHIACANDLSTDSHHLLLEYLSKHADIKKMLEEKDNDGWTCLHHACCHNLSADSLCLLFEYLAKHTDIKKMLEGKDEDGRTCLDFACISKISHDSLRLLLDYLFEHADIKKVLEEKNRVGSSCLHFACHKNFSTDSLRLLLEYLSKHADIKKMFEAKTSSGKTCLHYACENNLFVDSLSVLLEYLSKHAEIKKVLEAADNDHRTCLHFACRHNLSTDSLRLLLEGMSKHADLKMLEQKDNFGHTCLHFACDKNFSPDSLRLLLEYLSKHADIKKMLVEKDSDGQTCLHYARGHIFSSQLSMNTLRLLVSFFPSNESLQLVLSSKAMNNCSPVDLAKTEELKELLQDPDCWQKSRYWLFCNYQETFLNSLYPNSPEKTLEALKELKKNHADDRTLKMVTLHQQNLVERLHVIPDESAARQALGLIALSTTENFHRDHVSQQENAEVRQLITGFQRLKPLSEEELDRQELEKLIFDRLSLSRLLKEALPILFEHGVTKESFFLLNENHLKEMGVKIGPRVQLLQIIEQETFRRNNLSARSDISSRPRSPGHTPRISGGVPPIALSASALIQRYQQQQKPPDDVMSFTETVSENGGSFKPQTDSTVESF